MSLQRFLCNILLLREGKFELFKWTEDVFVLFLLLPIYFFGMVWIGAAVYSQGWFSLEEGII